MKIRYCRLYLVFVAIFSNLVDFSFTANIFFDNSLSEGEPITAFIISLGMFPYIFFVLLWISLATFLILLLPEIFSKFICFLLTIGNGFGALTWISHYFGSVWIKVYIAFLALLLTICMTLYENKKLKYSA